MWKQEYTNMFQLEDEYWWYRGLHELIERYVRDESHRQRPNILDAGCGCGKLMTIMSRYGEVSGFDFSEDAIRFCKERGFENVTQQDLKEWEPPHEAYDIVTCIDVLCHRAVPDVGDVLAKFRQSLKPHGVVILNLPAFEILKRPHDTVVNTVRRSHKKETNRVLREQGFDIEVSSYRLPFLFVVIAVRKLISVFESEGPPASDLRPIPSFLNALLLLKHRGENGLIASGLTMPFGSSLFIVARKGESGGSGRQAVDGGR
jgi:SAM-dependent methyltransferase